MSRVKTSLNKTELERVNSFIRNARQDIYSVYKKPSDNKITVIQLLLEQCRNLGGSVFTVVGGNSNIVQVAFLLKNTHKLYYYGACLTPSIIDLDYLDKETLDKILAL